MDDAARPLSEGGSGAPRTRILVVDADRSDRLALAQMLRREGFGVTVAANGAEALARFRRARPDVVLMGVVMPEMDGYEATRRIKALTGDSYLPVIFLTSVDEEAALARCVSAGGDDFLPKPYRRVLLRAKIDAQVRTRALYQSLKAHKDALALHAVHIEREHEVAERLFSRLARVDLLDAHNIRYLLSPQAIFNGDLLLASPTPSGGLRVLVGDFTGHGLVAAVGALPASEIFYGMTAKGFSISEVVREIGRKLGALLPTGLFFAATVVELDAAGRNLTAWCGGMPDGLLLRAGDGSLARLPSQHLPLGIDDPGHFDGTVTRISVGPGDRLYLFSDGVTEARSPSGEMVGEARLVQWLRDGPPEADACDRVSGALKRFRGGARQADDITFVELRCEPPGGPRERAPAAREDARPPMDWRLALALEASALRSVDPLPVVLQVLMELQGLHAEQADLYAVLAELFNNALDHGLLGLDSALKCGAEGFADYYAERLERMQRLDRGRVELVLEQHATPQGGSLVIHVRHEGTGFDAARVLETRADPGRLSGRGIPLVRSLCSSLAYHDEGRHAEAVYEWCR